MTAATLGDRLGAARRERFVGRTGELELFRAALDAGAEASFAVLYMHGPAGIGKSALLARFAEVALDVGATPIRIDGRSAEPRPEGFLGALQTALRLPAGSDPLAELSATSRAVVLIDTYEVLAPIDTWLRDQVLPQLPADSLVVLASRSAPSAGWSADPGWSGLLRVISLRNLPPADSRAYLRSAGVPERLHEQVSRVTYGHPLALSLVAEVAHQRGGVPSLDDVPDVVRRLVESFVENVPDRRHRDVLATSAHARFTTEALLHEVVGSEHAGPMFDWLRGLTFVEHGRHGLHPHDIARDVLVTDLRWRDPARFAELRRLIRRYLVDTIQNTTGAEQLRAGTEFIFLLRTNPIVQGFWDWTTAGRAYTDRFRDSDRDPILAMTERHQGVRQAELVAYWIDRPAATFFPVRDGGGAPIGYGATLALHEATSDDLAADPGAAAIWAYVQHHGPPRPGERVGVARFYLDRDLGQQQCPSNIAVSAQLLRDVLTTPRLAWYFVASYTDAEYWEPLYTYVDYHRAREAEFSVDGRGYAVFGHDHRRLGIEDWLDMVDEREFGPTGAQLTGAAPMLVLSQPDFSEAVRLALRDLHRPDRLAANPLLRSRVVQDRGDATAETLRALLGESARTLRLDPRDEKYFRAVDRTYLRPAPTQERAAELLGVPFSTYRRHLGRGVGQVVEVLWQREVYGPSEVGRLDQPAPALDEQ